MSASIERLHELSQRAERRILGLMSGTSLDGLDLALCRIRGAGEATDLTVERFVTTSYDADTRARIAPVFSTRRIDLEYLTVLNAWLGRRHGQLVNQCLAEWGLSADQIDLVASHGQTVYHAPAALHGRPDFPNATLQIGDGDHVAVTTGITTVSDFRQKHIAAGGEGAPLVVYGDYYVFANDRESRLLVNIGGIANITWLPAGATPNQVVASDVGPGNTLMDATVQSLESVARFDEDAARARRGRVHDRLLKALLDHPFFDAEWPKTAGPELFNASYIERAARRAGTDDVSADDLLATLNRFSVESIALAVERIGPAGANAAVYVSGGGARNPLLLESLIRRLAPRAVATTADLGVDPDAKEAVLFAVLANEAVAGEPAAFGGLGLAPVTLGKFSFAR